MSLPIRLRADLPGPVKAGAIWLALVACVAAAGCASSAANRRGQDAEIRQDYDRAVAEYTKLLRLKPNDGEARRSLERARLRAANDHFERGRRFAAVGKYEEALVEYQLASEMNPTSGVIEDSLRSTRNQLRAKVAVAREGKTAPADQAGGSFTITNVGVFGVDAGTPIINPGEAAILAFGAVRKQPWVVNDEIVPRWITTLALSFDHRLIDGEKGSIFLSDVASILEDPARPLMF